MRKKMVVIQDHSINLLEREQGRYTIKQGIAKSFYGQHGYMILHQAQEHGNVFTLPEFLQLCCLKFNKDEENPLWRIPFTLQTEEIIGKSKTGNPVVVVAHGAGLLTPKRIRTGIIIEELVDGKVPDHGLTRTASGRGQFALPLHDDEVHALVEGQVLPVYQYSDFKNGISDLPREYAVVRDFDPNTELLNGDYNLSILKKVPRLIMLAGGVENLESCLDLLASYRGITEMNYSHPLHYIDPEQPQGRFVEVHGLANLFYSFMEMDGPARFLAVKRENLEEKFDQEIILEVS